MTDEFLKQIVDKLNTIDNRTSDMQKQLDRHEKKLNAIMEQVVKNSEDITEIKDNQHNLAVGQAKQDRILEMLAARSLDQEAQIKDIKRVK